jgi:hypothetical protein
MAPARRRSRINAALTGYWVATAVLAPLATPVHTN